MKKKLTNNIALKILSLVLATILWLVITNLDDPVKTKTLSNIPVTILNESVIDTPNQMYEIIEGEKVTFKVAARRKIIDQLTNEDFRVTADFSKLLNGNTVMIEIRPKRYANEIAITEGRYQTLTIQLEELSEEDFRVNVIPVGELAEGYHIAERVASPNIIRVAGPKSRIDKIKEVVAEVDVTASQNTIKKIAEPKALDENGNAIDASKLTFSSRYVEVGLVLYKTKTVDLLMDLEGSPANGYIMTEVEYEPKTITIAAASELLDQISSLKIPYSIDGATENIEKDINLRDVLDLSSGVILVEDDTVIGISIKIEKLESKEIVIWPVDIELKNKKDNLTVNFNTTGPIRVKVRGPESEISTITKATLKPYIDLADYSVGTYAMFLRANLPEHTELYDTPMVSTRLTP